MANVILKVKGQIERSCANVLQVTLEKCVSLTNALQVAIRTKNAVAKIAVHALMVFVNVNMVGVVMRVTNQAVKRLTMAIYAANQLKVFATLKKDNAYVLLVSVASTVIPKCAKRILTMA
jgi:hypothetical protein